MPIQKRFTGSQWLVVAAGVLIVVVGIFIANGAFSPKSEPAVTGNETVVPAPGTAFLEPAPTDIVQTGAIDAVNSGQGQDELSLVQKKGEDVTYTKLIIDDHSYCNMGRGGLPCMAMSVTYAQMFGGKRALVDGNKEGDSIRVRRLRVYDGDDMPRATDPGSVYIPWARVSDMIAGCEVRSLLQTHEGLVRLITKTDTAYTAVEPVIDEVMRAAAAAEPSCGNIHVAAE